METYELYYKAGNQWTYATTVADYRTAKHFVEQVHRLGGAARLSVRM